MGMFDDLLNTAGGMLGKSGGGSQNILGAAASLLGGNGDLSGLVEKFKQNGLGDIISSWVGTGINLPISADQIQQALGSDTLNKVASQLRLSPEEASSTLSNLLPGIIDKLTPDGKVPEGNIFTKGLDLLGMFGK